MDQDPAIMARRTFLRRGAQFTAGLVVLGALAPEALSACGDGSTNQSVGQSPDATPTTHTQAEPAATSTAPAEALVKNPNQQVEGAGKLEDLSDVKFWGVMQFFTVSESDAQQWQALALQQTVAADLHPISIIGTDGLNLASIDERQVHGYFDTLLSTYLNEPGMSTDLLGPIVVCPEFIAGYSGNPNDYANDLNKFLRALKRANRSAPSSNMIDMSSYEVDNLLPTLPDVDQDLLDSVGIQALANGRVIPIARNGDEYKANVKGFFDAKKIMEVDEALGKKPIWINTAIIRQDANPGVDASYTVEERVAIAEAIADEIAELTANNVEIIAVNLFAENKLDGVYPQYNSEKRDFSFHPGDEEVLIVFAKRLRALGVPLSVFAIPNDIAK
jgi:hypothetical protein